ncbi:MAG: hypothetical protein JW983_06870 [Elusimicrobia bacterium]|nr:hypothetical protein [Elusimicrobiota bacterium]
MKLSKREKILFYVTIVVVITGLGYSYIFYPQIEKSKFMDDIISQKKSELNRSLKLLKTKSELESKIEEIRSKTDFKKSPEEQLAILQVNLEKLIRKSGATQIKSISPLSAAYNRDDKKISMQLDIRCTLAGLCRLLYRLNTLPILTSVRKLQVYTDGNDPSGLRVQMIIDSLWFDKDEKKN